MLSVETLFVSHFVPSLLLKFSSLYLLNCGWTDFKMEWSSDDLFDVIFAVIYCGRVIVLKDGYIT